MFATTTVLDFVHAFRRDEPRDEMVRQIALACWQMGATLHAYVVMPHHVHLVVTLPPRMDVRVFMRRFKPDSSKVIMKLLTSEERCQFSAQTGLNRNTFWMRSFKSFVVDRESGYAQKVSYIHSNPVEAGYVAAPHDYRWSSAQLYEAGKYDNITGFSHLDVLETVKRP